MQSADLHKNFFSSGTRGYTILSRFYYKYHDLFIRTDFPEFKEFLNQVFLNISSIDFSKDIKNKEAYIIASIKIQCRVQLDKALKIKNKMVLEYTKLPETSEENSPIENIESNNPGPQEELETGEVFQAINIFKLSLKSAELELFNNLIDDIPRKEMAEKQQMNLNTLDTRIRRLRIKFLVYLKRCGYNFNMFDKYEQ